MAEGSDNLVLEMLRRLSGRFDRFQVDIGALKTRLSSPEKGVALIRQDMTQQSMHIAALNTRMDRMDNRLTEWMDALIASSSGSTGSRVISA